MTPDKNLIDARFKEAIDSYVVYGRPLGGFLNYVLSNNLSDAVLHADSAALLNLPHIIAYLWNDVPSGAWGSPGVVAAWCERIAARRGAA